MFNVAVIRLKDLVKYLSLTIGIILIVIFIKKIFIKQDIRNINLGQKLSDNMNKYIQDAIALEIPEISQINNKKQQEMSIEEANTDDMQVTMINKMLGLELEFINVKENNKEETKNEKDDNNEKNKGDNKEENKETADDDRDKNIELAKTDVSTEITTQNPIADTYTLKYKGVKIKNETSYDLTDEDLNYDNIKIEKNNIIIFHTHTCESYTSSKEYSYTPTGNYRTTDLKYSVARVGDELTKYLKKYDFNVIHDKTYHDYPSYNGSYTRSLSTVSKILKTSNADIIIDLHRDAIGSNSSYAPTVKIDDETCAQLMFVMGSNGGGLKHSNWKNNLKFAIKIQELANNTYPGLFKPIILRNSRYNQHLGKAACIIEVGSTGNTLEQCLKSMKYLSKIISEYK